MSLQKIFRTNLYREPSASSQVNSTQKQAHFDECSHECSPDFSGETRTRGSLISMIYFLIKIKRKFIIEHII